MTQVMEVRGVSAVVWAMVLTNYGAASVCCQSMLQGGRGLVNQNMGSSRYKGYYDRFDGSQNSGYGQQAVQGAFPEYSTEALVVSQLSQMDNLMNVIRSIPHPEKMNPAYKAVYSAPAADLLGSLARAQEGLTLLICKRACQRNSTSVKITKKPTLAQIKFQCDKKMSTGRRLNQLIIKFDMTNLAKLTSLLFISAIWAETSVQETRKLTRELRQADALIAQVAETRGTVLSRSRKTEIYRDVAKLLRQLTDCEVDLISKRTGPQGEMIDKLLTKIEEKSYQLKTTLIQLHQTEGVTTYFPTTIPTPRYPYYGLQPSLSVYGNPFG
ncbi:hypothetical protein GE061_008397 [Apolygus lucorum]|uniref:Uncharacterized protein n=1 Tax=Apolygus lucorum TaxID=248454 RepID=A0A8S9WTC0_APOLU|nr:hypothetical protein GE061_008397 [Apolygus lucorum]